MFSRTSSLHKFRFKRPIALIRLRVLSGPQAGAVETLGHGLWLLGSGAHCDLVVRDPGINAEQLKLNVDSWRVLTTMLPAAEDRDSKSPEQQNGRRVPVTRNWSAGDVLALAGSTLVWELESNVAKPFGSAAQGIRSGAARKPLTFLSLRARWTLGAVAVLALAVTLAIQVNRANAGRQPIVDRADRQNSRQSDSLSARLQAQGFTEVGVRRTKDGSQSVVGWVRDRGESNRLRKSVEAFEVQTHIVEADEQIRFAQEYLSAHGHSAAVRYLGDGVLLVQASGDDETGFRERVHGLHQAAPMVRHFEIEYTGKTMALAAPIPQNPERSGDRQITVSGIDGISMFGSTRFLTSGTHYVFEGGVLRDGFPVPRIDTNLVALSSGRGIQKETTNAIRPAR